jgi:hypothetical protein
MLMICAAILAISLGLDETLEQAAPDEPFPNLDPERRPGMFSGETYAAVRRFVFVEGKSQREAARVFGLSRETMNAT